MNLDEIPTEFKPWTGEKSRLGLVGYIRTNWSQDPYSFGSYSHVAKGSKQKDRRIIEEPIDNKIFFAGEALHPLYNSSVHAAHESGLKVADRIVGTEVKNVAIIGAGISGLTAAHALSKTGINVKVFEARDRIGGRLWTDTGMGAPVDLGASWIHGIKKNPLVKLAENIGMEMVELKSTGGKSHTVRGKDGKILKKVPKWYGEVLMQQEAAVETKKVNKWHYLYDAIFRGHPIGYYGKDVVLPTGYFPILQNFQGDYDVELSSPVSGISLTDTEVELQVKDDATVAFDAVIVTVPLGVLKKGSISFNPPLSEKKQNSINKLGFGVLDKVYLLFEKPFWDESTWIITPENDLPRGYFNTWLNFDGVVEKPILMAFNAATPAIEIGKLSDEEVIGQALSTLEKAFPDA